MKGDIKGDSAESDSQYTQKMYSSDKGKEETRQVLVDIIDCYPNSQQKKTI